MSGGFHWWDYLHNEYLDHHAHVAGGATAIATIVGSGIVYRALAPKFHPQADDSNFVPGHRFGFQNLVEVIGEFIQGVAKGIIGDHYAPYLPLLSFIFVWTLLNNMLGMVPGFASATDNLNTTLAMGLLVFFYYNYQGFRSHGFKYLEHYTGHLHGVLLLILGPVMFVIELVSHMVRPVTLGIRLRSNIYGDHTIYGIVAGLFKDLAVFMSEKFGTIGGLIGSLIAALGPVPIVCLGLLIAFIQAFVFTLLTTIYVGMATAHEDH
jgi:F-type H+-transporting ATPase subunit a